MSEQGEGEVDPADERRKWACCGLLLAPLVLAPVSLVGAYIAFSEARCGAWRAPAPWPGVTATVTHDHSAGSMTSDLTTRSYRVSRPLAEVERYFLDQMRQVCQPDQIRPFVPLNDPASPHPSRYAECRIRGSSMPTPNGTPDQWDHDMEYRAKTYESLTDTQQIFQVDLVQIEPGLVEVVQREAISAPC